MSSIRVKTAYEVTGAWGSTETKTLYAVHNGSTDTVTFYDEDGDFMFSVEDTVDNNLFEAINRLFNYTSSDKNVTTMNKDDINKLKY